jgi:hypothetical protein
MDKTSLETIKRVLQLRIYETIFNEKMLEWAKNEYLEELNLALKEVNKQLEEV